MRGIQTEVDSSGPSVKPPKLKRLSAAELDELCLTCGDMRRSHIDFGRKKPCGVAPCPCTDFVASGIYHDWSGGATVTIHDTEAALKAQCAAAGLEWPPKWLAKTSARLRERAPE